MISDSPAEQAGIVMRRITWIYAIAAAAVPVAFAVGPQVGMLRGSLGVEAEFTVDGAAIRPAYYDISAVVGEEAHYEVDGVDMSDAFDPAYGGRAELAYGIDNNVEVFGSVGYSKASGQSNVNMGTITLPASDQLFPIVASFGDLEQWSIEAGARYYAGAPNSFFRPFFGGSVGVVFVDGVAMNTQSAYYDAWIDEYFESSTLFTAGVEAGVVFGEGNLSGSLSVGAKYVSELKTNDEALDALGLQAFAGDNDRIVIPVKGTLSYSF
jgi:hypothetical protein